MIKKDCENSPFLTYWNIITDEINGGIYDKYTNFEKNGYDYFYKIDKNEADPFLDDMEFLADGTVWKN